MLSLFLAAPEAFGRGFGTGIGKRVRRSRCGPKSAIMQAHGAYWPAVGIFPPLRR